MNTCKLNAATLCQDLFVLLPVLEAGNGLSSYKQTGAKENIWQFLKIITELMYLILADPEILKGYKHF